MTTTLGTAPIPIPPLIAGDRLTRDEFERRYRAMTDVKKAELIEGIVYMPSPVSTTDHGSPHFDLISWMGYYRAFTPGAQGADNATVRLDWLNEPQPDAFLRILPEFGGQSRTSADGKYVEGSPELTAEVAASSASYDLHAKHTAYCRNGVLEYIVWRVWDDAIDWFRLRGGAYQQLAPAADGILRSEVFPGLWLDPAALLSSDMARVLEVVHNGTRSPEHAAFVAGLAANRRTP